MKSLLLALCFALGAFGAEPKVITCESQAEAWERACNYVEVLGGRVAGPVSFTGSMKPFLIGGEFVVLRKDFPGVRPGKVVLNGRLLHRARGRKYAGLPIWVTRGDANLHDDAAPLTASTYGGTLEAVFRPARS